MALLNDLELSPCVVEVVLGEVKRELGFIHNSKVLRRAIVLKIDCAGYKNTYLSIRYSKKP